ncbi:MAG TPA: 2-amino-4-hydroxy-6-hydroxymethyldihydropteridine diphosphokinase [bacterium]|nr:2-amino-4-hydroxy-6-hydroxymethyldihydropteridine diphosphokinase [bacterium]
MIAAAAAGSRAPLRRAILLEWVSMAWMLAEGGVAVAAGVAARSLSLEVFGLDSLIELIAGAVVLWRLLVEARSASDWDVRRVAAAERLSARIVAGCLLVLAAYIFLGAVERIRGAAGVAPGLWGFGVSLAALLGMPWLSSAKRRVARVLGSEALREDAMGNLACGLMAGVVLVGLVAQRGGLRWADPAAALLLGAFVLREGWEALGRTREGAEGPASVFLSLGSNLGDRAHMLAQARALLDASDLRIVAVSHVYESLPWGKIDQPAFLNQVVQARTTLAPAALLARCLEVEARLGRVRTIRWGPRTIDIDILLYDALELATPDLVIPHAELRRRAFVLVPLAELVPGLRLPDGASVEALVGALPDREAVRACLPDPSAAGADR